MPDPSVSVIVLAYNEEASLEAAVLDVVRTLRATPERPFEVIIVDDGSTDGTPEVARALCERHPEVRVVRHPENRGPGSGILTGFAEARRDLVCFHPGDGQIPFADLAAALPLLDDHDLVIGHRTARPGYTLARRAASMGYILLAQALFGLWRYQDFNNVYLYRRSLLQQIRPETHGVFMPTEVLVKAVDLGARIAPARITCLPRQSGVATCGRPSVVAQTFGQMMRFWASWRWRRLRQPPSPRA